MSKSKYPYKTASWESMIKNDKDFSRKFELNTNPRVGPTFIPRKTQINSTPDDTIFDDDVMSDYLDSNWYE